LSFVKDSRQARRNEDVNSIAPKGNQVRMQDLVSSLMLICAALAALALGVLLAYGFFHTLFLALRIHAQSMTPQPKPQVARVS
jgi:hypothetical protein